MENHLPTGSVAIAKQSKLSVLIMDSSTSSGSVPSSGSAPPPPLHNGPQWIEHKDPSSSTAPRESLVAHSSLSLPIAVPVQARLFDYRGERVAGFEIAPSRQILCLPQVFEIFLKQFVGGLHTVYTKLKRLGIHPLICNVEQVRALRSLGAIQPGVNRCKLIETEDFETLYKDCTNMGARPGRPPKRTPSGNMVEEESSVVGVHQSSSGLWRRELQKQGQGGSTNLLTSSLPQQFGSSSLFSPSFFSNLMLKQSSPSLPMHVQTDTFSLMAAQQLQQHSTQQLSEQNNTPSQLLPQLSTQQLLFSLHHAAAMAAAAAAAVVQQEQRTEQRREEPQSKLQCEINVDIDEDGQQAKLGEGEDMVTAGEGDERREEEEEREQSMDCISNGGNGSDSLSGASSASTTMHGDLEMNGCANKTLVRLKATDGSGPSPMPGSFSSGSRHSSSYTNGSNTDNVAKKHRKSDGNEEARSSSDNTNGESPPADDSPSSGDSVSRDSKLRRRQGSGEANYILNRLNQMVDRVESALKGHCEQLGALTSSLQSELRAAKSSKIGAELKYRFERRKSEMFGQKYASLRKHLRFRPYHNKERAASAEKEILSNENECGTSVK